MKRTKMSLLQKMMLAFSIPLLMGGLFTGTVEAAESKPLIVGYEGLFTSPVIESGECKAEEMDVIGGKPIDAEPTEGKVAKIFVDIVSGIVKPVVDVLFSLDCPGVDNDKFSLVSEVLKIASPLNLTQNYIIMKLVSITQSLGFVIAFVLVVVYGFMYMTGFENLNPVKFGVRLFFAMIFVYYLPYLMQDILNINNVVVHYLSSINVTFAEGNKEVSFVFAGAIADWIGSIVDNFMVNLLTLILAIAMIYFALAPIIKIIVWWYVRMLKIFFYAIIGPIIVIMMALPQTSSLASKWVKDFVGEVFAQIFMVLAMAMLAFIMGNMTAFADMTNIGWLGTLLVMYGAIYFLAEVPTIASSFLGSIGGLSAEKLATGATRATKQATGMVKNTAANAVGGAKNAVAARENGQRFSTLKSMGGAKGFTGKAGALAGALAGKAVTARAPKISKGEDGKLSLDKARSLKDMSDTKVKPKIQNFNASRQEKKMDKSVGYAEQSNKQMHTQQAEERQADARRTAKQLGLGEDAAQHIQGQSLNERTAGSRQEVETGRDVVANLKRDGSIERASELNSIQKGTPPDDGGGGGKGKGPTGGYSDVFQGDKFNDKPMNNGDFQTLNDKLSSKDQKSMTPNEVRKRSQERVKGHQEHNAAYFGGAGAGSVERANFTSSNDKSTAIDSLKKNSSESVQQPGGSSIPVKPETGSTNRNEVTDISAKRTERENGPKGKEKGDTVNPPPGSPKNANGGTNERNVVAPTPIGSTSSAIPSSGGKNQETIVPNASTQENASREERKVDKAPEKSYEGSNTSNVAPFETRSSSETRSSTTSGTNDSYESANDTRRENEPRSSRTEGSSDSSNVVPFEAKNSSETRSSTTSGTNDSYESANDTRRENEPRSSRTESSNDSSNVAPFETRSSSETNSSTTSVTNDSYEARKDREPNSRTESSSGSTKVVPFETRDSSETRSSTTSGANNPHEAPAIEEGSSTSRSTNTTNRDSHNSYTEPVISDKETTSSNNPTRTNEVSQPSEQTQRTSPAEPTKRETNKTVTPPLDSENHDGTEEAPSSQPQTPPPIGTPKKGKGIYYKDVVDHFQGKKDVDADLIAKEMKVSAETAKKLHEQLQKDKQINQD